MITTKVTVPTRAELKGRLYFVTDYAIATGTNCSWDVKERSDTQWGRCSDIWLRTSDRLHDGQVETSNMRYQRESTTQFTDFKLWKQIRKLDCRTWEDMDSADIGVLPRIQNPAAMGITLSNDYFNNVVIIKGRKPLYPQTLVDAKLGTLLSTLREEKNGLIEVGSYDDNKCYYFAANDNFYTYVPKAKPAGPYSVFDGGITCKKDQGYWFLCKPVEAERCPDTSIQFGNVLFAKPFETSPKLPSHYRRIGNSRELDTNEFTIGQYLQNNFLNDLIKSTEFQAVRSVSKIAGKPRKISQINLGHQMLKKSGATQTNNFPEKTL